MKSNDFLKRGLIAIVAALMAQAPLVHAGLIGPEAALQNHSAPSQAEQDRAKVQSFLDRANVKERMQALGVNGVVAKDRVDALSEDEVHALAQRIDGMPAGGAVRTNEWILIVLIAILVVLVL